MCKFYVPTGDKSCRIRRYEWSQYKYTEKPTLTPKEKKLLNILLPGCKYIVRDENNRLYVYYQKPVRKNELWTSNDDYYYISISLFGNMFDFIKWEDEEPWSIEDLKKLEVKDE